MFIFNKKQKRLATIFSFLKFSFLAPNDDNKLLALNRDEVFSCLSYQRLCPICSGMLESCNSGILKRLAVYERCKNSRRSCLSFTTKHRQIWIRVTFTASCPACVARLVHYVFKILMLINVRIFNIYSFKL